MVFYLLLVRYLGVTKALNISKLNHVSNITFLLTYVQIEIISGLMTNLKLGEGWGKRQAVR